MRQISFFKEKDFPTAFGGELLKGRRKKRRPLSSKKALHEVLRADVTRCGSLLKQRNFINSTLDLFAQKFSIKIYSRGLASNHIHFVLKFKSISDYKSFIRAVTGVIAKTLKLKWIYRPYTKVLQWGAHFRKACKYVIQNELEGLGLIPYLRRAKNKSPPE